MTRISLNANPTTDHRIRTTLVLFTAFIKSVLFIALLLMSVNVPLRAEVVDRIVAVVGSEVITEGELTQAYTSDVLGLMRPNPLTGSNPEALSKEQYLDQLIQRKVIEVEVKKQGIRVDALEVEKAIDRKRESLGLTEDEFKQALSMQGVSMEQYREDVKQQLITYRLISQEVRGEIEVSEEEIRSFYQQHSELFVEKDKLRLSHIFIPFPKDGGTMVREAAIKQLEKIRADIAAGADFGEMARTYSKTPTAPTGGDLGWFSLHELLPEFRDQVSALSEGQMSPVFVHGKGAHLVLLAEVKQGEIMPLSMVREKIADIIYQQEAMERYDLWLERLKVRTHIENRLTGESSSPY